MNFNTLDNNNERRISIAFDEMQCKAFMSGYSPVKSLWDCMFVGVNFGEVEIDGDIDEVYVDEEDICEMERNGVDNDGANFVKEQSSKLTEFHHLSKARGNLFWPIAL